MKLASFDIEISDQLSSPGEPNYPPHISCAAIALSDAPDNVIFYTASQDAEYMTPVQVASMIRDMADYVVNGYTFLTWNGIAFDFPVVAANCKDFYASTYKALEIAFHNHIDMMLLVTFQTGYRLSLQSALLGANLAGKLHEVPLSDGTIITDMSGAKAPELWVANERKAVLEYLSDDVTQPLLLAQYIETNKCINWQSKAGRPMRIEVPALYTVEEAYQELPPPQSVNWMADPIFRDAYLRKYLPGVQK